MRRRARGFTLIETLAAFTILSLVLIELFGGLTMSVRSDMRAAFDETAARAGRSLLARLGGDLALVEGRTTGMTDDGLGWTMIVTPRPTPRGVRSAFWVELTLRDAAHALTLNTLEIGEKAPTPP